jgi:hypothetical protein
MEHLASEWLSIDPDELANKSTSWPEQLDAWWSCILANANLKLSSVSEKVELVTALMGIVAAADNVCFGFGILRGKGKDSKHQRRAYKNLSSRSKSLCEAVHPSRAVTLPKFHNPTEGMTIRALTHNIALWDKREVSAEWFVTPILGEREQMNVLVLPWPLTIPPSAFRPVDDIPDLQLAEGLGLFTFDLPQESFNLDALEDLVIQAEDFVGTVDVVVFPELSLRDSEFESLGSVLKKQRLWIAGVGEPAENGKFGRNKVRIGINWRDEITTYHEQDKHHRWHIDDYQISQYGIGCSLADKVSWWEATDIRKRSCTFFGANRSFTFCALICEDLARQDPMAELVRSVGPNLVIALLMDGPQIPERWSARYSTVLAEDPRSSVLTLTSAGLVDLAISQDFVGPRSVGLWKDPQRFARKIILKPGAEGIILCLNREFAKEWTADGRDDGGSTAYLRLTGIHQVYPRGRLRASPAMVVEKPARPR